MTRRSMPCLFHATLFALGAARLRMLNLLRSIGPLPKRDRFILVGFTCCFVDMTARVVMARAEMNATMSTVWRLCGKR